VLAVAAGGCGRERLAVPDASRPASSLQTAQRSFPEVGVRFEAPADWTFQDGQAPLVTSTTNGTATVAVWRYPRTEPLPDADDMADARDALADAARQRDPTFDLAQARIIDVDGAAAVQLVGRQRVGGRPRRVRSTHVYAKGAEVVVDAFVDPRDFEAVDRSVFRPLVRSLKIDPPAAG
jgi:hypothetical protein